MVFRHLIIYFIELLDYQYVYLFREMLRNQKKELLFLESNFNFRPFERFSLNNARPFKVIELKYAMKRVYRLKFP